ELQMPPDERLSPESIEMLAEWIKRGAPDPRKINPVAKNSIDDSSNWWSLRPITRPSVPQHPSDVDAAAAIDAFVMQRLDGLGLSPSPRADRRTLIRRLYFDLHGLPPTPEQVDAFVSDPDPLAYEKLIDRLLDSPRYGERWARHWLDTVHFADSQGCEHDTFRANAWRYRDYVIDSLNGDTAWPRFIREQLAADRLFPNEPQLTAALGFIAAGPQELSRAGTAPVTFDYLDRDDMVTQTMAAFASTTANCARCHDHKFDPISQSDYYALQAVFAGVGKGDIEYDKDANVAENRRKWNDILAAVKRNDSQVVNDPEHNQIVSDWEANFGKHAAVWEPLKPATFVSSGNALLKRLDDHSILATEARPEQDTYTITTSTSLSALTALRLDVLADESLPMKGPGRADNGNFHLSQWEAYVFHPDSATSTPLKFRRAVADWNQEGWTIDHALDDDAKTAWGIYPKVGQSHHAVFELSESIPLTPLSQIVVVLKQLHGGSHLIGRVKIYATDAEQPAADVLPDSVLAAIKTARAERTGEQQTAINGYAIRMYAEQQLANMPAMQTVFAASNQYSRAVKLSTQESPKIVHVLHRGDINQPRDVAQPGALSAVKSLPDRFHLNDPNDEGTRRVALANWLAANENPLTWRSVVNRVWQYHFGRGLCETPNDFGRMGSPPSHRELLDWLAVWFRDDAKGSLKELHRAILSSETYRRSTTVDEKSYSTDPGNQFLSRRSSRKLDAESFRDAILQISGRLDLTMGGPGVQQFSQVKGPQATPTLDYDAFDWNAPGAGRRSVYRVVWRGIADPFMESLDFPDLGLLSPKRGSSVSALQSLALFNNDFVLHHSQTLADQLDSDLTDSEDQIKRACQLVYLRDPTERELNLLSQYTLQHGLAATCRILFNSNEFLFVD
ncbi:MAG: DUF1549 domain-containing protein, partial [Planctomycetales bacterium]|nr:DUF1549 domain-containing protein [Planctomycetales bacterium]